MDPPAGPDPVRDPGLPGARRPARRRSGRCPGPAGPRPADLRRGPGPPQGAGPPRRGTRRARRSRLALRAGRIARPRPGLRRAVADPYLAPRLRPPRPAQRRPDRHGAQPRVCHRRPARRTVPLGDLRHDRHRSARPRPARHSCRCRRAARSARLCRRWHPPRPADPSRRSGCPGHRARRLAGRRAPPAPAPGRRTAAAVDPARLGTDHTRNSQRTDRPRAQYACTARSEGEVRPMTFRTESRITIAGSVHEVWAYLCDVGRWPEWAPTVLEGRIRGGGPLQPGSRVEQRAKLMFGMSRSRSQEVTVVEPPRSLAFAGPMGTSAARWGMEFEPADDRRTDTMMWIEVDLAGIMRAIPARMLKGRIQRVSDIEMVAIKAAVESGARERSTP